MLTLQALKWLKRPKTSKCVFGHFEIFKSQYIYKTYFNNVHSSGTGIAPGIAAVIAIPSNVKELNKRLNVLMPAYNEGHKDTYNEINGILKELLNQKEINEKQYKFIIESLS